MIKRIRFAPVAMVLLALFGPVFGQRSVEERLDRLEARVDSILSILRSQRGQEPPSGIMSDSLNLRFGISGDKGTILDKRYFVINHNNHWKIPYWVAYCVTAADLRGIAGRTDDFRPDPELPVGSRVELADYRNSGYDRGHNAPAADFKRSREAMSTTFLLSNMCPQTPELNRQIWENLESQVRQMTQERGRAWVVTGSLFMSPDSQSTSPQEFIGANNVAVPTHCFKVALFVDGNGNYSMYAFMMPNLRDNIPGVPADYMLRVDRLESITGYDFFPLLDDAIENRLESTIQTWPR